MSFSNMRVELTKKIILFDSLEQTKKKKKSNNKYNFVVFSDCFGVLMIDAFDMYKLIIEIRNQYSKIDKWLLISFITFSKCSY